VNQLPELWIRLKNDGFSILLGDPDKDGGWSTMPGDNDAIF